MKLSLYIFIAQAILSVLSMALGVAALGGVFGFASGNKTLGVTVTGGSIALMFVVLVVYALVYAWAQGAFVMLFHRPGSENDVSEAIQGAKPLIGPLWWASVLVGLTVFIGFALLIIPGVIFAVWYSFTTMVVILEGLRGNDAMRKSKSYVQGRWGGIFLRILVLGIVMAIVNAITSQIFDAFGNYASAILTSLVTAFIITPFAIVYQYLLYRSVADGTSSDGSATSIPTN